MPRTRQVSDDLTLKLRDLERRLAVAETRAAIPAGSIVATGATAAPTGWLLCDGSAVSRADYSDLFAAIGVAYGAGDGSSTFNLPDFRGRFLLGKAAAGTGSTLGGSGGSIDHVHDLNTSSSFAAIVTSTNVVQNARRSGVSWGISHQLNVTGSITSPGGTQTIGSELGGNSAAANPPFQTANVIIKF